MIDGIKKLFSTPDLSSSEGASRRVRAHRPDYKIVLFMGLLVLLGLIILFAISPYQIERINAEGGSLSQNHYMLKQLTYLGIGLTAFIIAALLPVAVWARYKGLIFLGAIGACLLLSFLGFFSLPPALCHNGACRWYDVGFGTFQPAEFLKFGLVLFTAGFLAMRIKQGKINNTSDTLVPLGILCLVAVVLIIWMQKDMGTGITILGSLAAMLFAAGIRLKTLAIGFSAMIGLGLLLIVTSPHRIARVMTLVDPSAAGDASNYHIEMATVAIGSGGVIGRGLGNGVQAFGYLPEALNDSIFAVLGETFGLLGLLVVLGLFVALLFRILRIAEHSVDGFMRLLAYGVFGWIATHVIVNVGAMTGIFPLTGVTLPFLSFGGTSLLFIMTALGIVYRSSKFTAQDAFEINEEGIDEDSRSRRGFRRARYARAGSYQRARS